MSSRQPPDTECADSGPRIVLDLWRATVSDVARQSGQDGEPTVRRSQGHRSDLPTPR